MKIENQAETKDAVETAPGPTSGEGAVKEKRRRAWEQWSPDDIAAFFEGLNEFGKDFDAIQNCLYTKSRKKNVVNATNIKNKDQVRHFYYRTWHKISKYLPTPDEGKRMQKELYGLINYGEMWKRLGGFFNEQLYREKLNELVSLFNLCLLNPILIIQIQSGPARSHIRQNQRKEPPDQDTSLPRIETSSKSWNRTSETSQFTW